MPAAVTIGRDAVLVVVEPARAHLYVAALTLLDAQARRDGGRGLPDDLADVRRTLESVAAVALDRFASAGAEVSSGNAGNADIMSSDEAAYRLGITSRRVRQLAEAGQLPGRRVGRRWTFTREEIDECRSSRRRPSRSTR